MLSDWCALVQGLFTDKIHFILSCLNFLRFQASRPSIAMDVAFVRTSAAKPATELSMQRAWGRPAGTCRRIVARDAEQGNEASWVTNHLFLRHVSPMNWKICLTKLLRLNWIYKKKTRGEAGREVRERSPKDASAATKTPAKIKSPFAAPCRDVDSKELRQGRQFSQSTFYHVYCTSVFAGGPNFSNFSEEEEAVHKSCSDLMQTALRWSGSQFSLSFLEPQLRPPWRTSSCRSRSSFWLTGQRHCTIRLMGSL